jgi:hypothetical protein
MAMKDPARTAELRVESAGEDQLPLAHRRGWRGPGPQWLVLGCYLLGSIAMTWRLWADPASHVQLFGTLVSNDVLDNDWFMRYAATAVAHGHLPALVTHALNAPQGINLMWNTGMLLPGVVLAPVTMLAGPQVSLTILLTLGFAGSAASMFIVLRRWGAATTAAVIGGAVYGFGPALVVAAQTHYFLEFAVLLPLIADLVLGIVTGRRHPVRAGVLLGLLICAQLFISEELMADTALAVVILVAVLALSRRAVVQERIGAAAAGLGTAAGVTLALCGYPLWEQFYGPLTQSGTPWAPAHFGNQPVDFVTAPSGLLLHSQNFLHVIGSTHQALSEVLCYLGWPLLVILPAAAVLFWGDLRVRATAVAFAIVEVFSVGPNPVRVAGVQIPAVLLPWHWISNLPLLASILPNRLSIIADGLAAAALAFALSRALQPRQAASSWRGWAAGLLAACALVPLIPMPLPAGPLTPPPAGWQTTFSRLRPGQNAPVLVIPVDTSQVMNWQAVTGQPGSLIGGYCLAPTTSGQASYCGDTFPRLEKDVLVSLDSAYARSTPYRAGRYYSLNFTHAEAIARLPTPAHLMAVLQALHPAAFVAVTSRDTPLGRFLVRYLGPPTVATPTVLGWQLHF